MAFLSHFSDILEKELNALIQKAIPEKTAGKYSIKNLKVGKKWIWVINLTV